MKPQTGVLTTVLNVIIKELLVTQAFIAPYADDLAFTFAMLSWLIFLARVTAQEEAPWSFAFKLVTLAALGEFVDHFADIAISFQQMLTFFGQRGLGGRQSILLDPSRIVDLGFDVAKDETKFALVAALLPTGTLIIGMIWTTMFLAIVVMAMFSFGAVIAWYVSLIVGTALMPFIMFKPTAWIATYALQGILAASVLMMVMCIMLSCAQPALTELARLAPPTTLKGFSVTVIGLIAVAGSVAWIPLSKARQVFGAAGNLLAKLSA